MTSRRSFLKGFAAFCAVAAAPPAVMAALEATAKRQMIVSTPVLPAGEYTFSCFLKRPGGNWIRAWKTLTCDKPKAFNLNLYDLMESGVNYMDVPGDDTTRPDGEPSAMDVFAPQLEHVAGENIANYISTSTLPEREGNITGDDGFSNAAWVKP